MQAYIARRLALSGVLALVSASLVFLVMRLVPGEVVLAALGEAAGLTPAQVAVKRVELGLDRPVLFQYVVWLRHAITGDLGVSFVNGRPVGADIVNYLARSAELMGAALVIGIGVGIPAGVYSAEHQDRWLDVVLTGASLIGVSVPNFVLGTLLVLVFGLRLRWLPVGTYEPFLGNAWLHLRLLALPAITLGLIQAAALARMSRASVLEVKSSEFVRTARSKGLAERIVLFRHVLRNALIPVVTLLGTEFGRLMGGAVIVEFVFTWPGVSTLLIAATHQRDYPMIQGVVLVVAGAFVVINLLVDVINAYLEPRIRYQ